MSEIHLSKKGKKKKQLDVMALLTLLPEYFVLANEELAFFSLVGIKFLTLLGGTFCRHTVQHHACVANGVYS